MQDFLNTIANRLNAPLFLGALTLNRTLILVIAAILAGTGIETLYARKRDRAGMDTFPVWAAGILAWKFFPALVNFRAVRGDPALVFAYTGGYGALPAALAAGALTACFLLLHRRKKEGKAAVRPAAAALLRNLLFVCAAAVPAGLLIALLPVPQPF